MTSIVLLCILGLVSPAFGDGRIVTGAPNRFYSSAGTTSIEQRLYRPSAVAVGRSSDLYVVDGGNSRIVRIDQSGRFAGEFGAPGGPNAIRSAGLGAKIVVGPSGDVLFAGAGESQIVVFDANGVYRRTLRMPFTVASFGVAPNGDVVVCPRADALDHVVFVFSADGVLRRSFGERLIQGRGPAATTLNCAEIAVGPDGIVSVAFSAYPLIRRYTADGALVGESAYSVPKGVLTDEEQSRFTLTRFQANPRSDEIIQPIALGLAMATDGSCAVFLNGAGFVKLGSDGRVVKQSRFISSGPSTFFAGIALDPSRPRVFLVDRLGAAIVTLESEFAAELL
jgi:hypothetical protein